MVLSKRLSFFGDSLKGKFCIPEFHEATCEALLQEDLLRFYMGAGAC